MALFAYSCDIINPSEQVPSWLRVDSAMLQIDDPSVQGSSIHGLTDCWVYVNGKMIGVFETPFCVPVLDSGKVNITIHPGIRNTGYDAKREIYPMLHEYSIDTILTPNRETKIIPIYKYRSGTEFLLVESFDHVGLQFNEDTASTVTMHVVNDDRSLENGSMYVVMDETHPNFECRSTNTYTLTETGRSFMEFSYKCNDYFTFGVFDLVYTVTSVTGVRHDVLYMKPTNDKWKRIFIDLGYVVDSSDSKEFQFFYTATHGEDSPEGKSEVFLDNIKLLHIETEAK